MINEFLSIKENDLPPSYASFPPDLNKQVILKQK